VWFAGGRDGGLREISQPEPIFANFQHPFRRRQLETDSRLAVRVAAAPVPEDAAQLVGATVRLANSKGGATT
jgi:hypothetical protein|tara:strand:- start:53 stop:268 length:216 start_codon:yes stop_codon:yes gene_type:complete